MSGRTGELMGGVAHGLNFGAAGELAEVAAWEGPDGVRLRVVRYRLCGPARAICRWARGLDLDAAPGHCLAGVALERRDAPGARWQTLTRHELESPREAIPTRRLDGWQAGLIARGAKLAARLGTAPTARPATD